MPRRRIAGVTPALLVGLLVTGCGTHTGSSSGPLAGPTENAAIVPTRETSDALRTPATSPTRSTAAAAAPPALLVTITPERATITSDDPGLQLLVSRRIGDDAIRDLTSRALWRVDPGGRPRSSRGVTFGLFSGARSRSSPQPIASALKLELEPEELVENLYLRTVCRPPTAEELSRWAAELKQASSLPEAAQDLFWSLLNSREFAFNH